MDADRFDPALLQAKCIAPHEAAELVFPGAIVFVGSACGTPRDIIAALEARVPAPPDVSLYHFVTTGAYDGTDEATTTNYYHRVFFVGTDMQAFLPTGKADYIPLRLSEVPRLLENGRIQIDIAFIQVSSPDANGYVSLGVSVDITMAVVRRARMVVAEVNPNMPNTYGETHIHISKIDHLVPVDTPLPTFKHTLSDEIAERIAQYIAGVIDDGSTLQIGLGRIPNEALRFLTDRRGVGATVRDHVEIVDECMIGAGAVVVRSITRPGVYFGNPARYIGPWD